MVSAPQREGWGLFREVVGWPGGGYWREGKIMVWMNWGACVQDHEVSPCPLGGGVIEVRCAKVFYVVSMSTSGVRRQAAAIKISQ